MQEIAYALITGNDKDVDQLTSKALDSGFTANTVMDDGLIAGMAIVGIAVAVDAETRTEINQITTESTGMCLSKESC